MLAPFATLLFLATIWLVTAIGAELLGGSARKVAAALRGRSLLVTATAILPVAARVSQRSRPQAPLRAQPQLQTGLRAAA